MTKIVRLSEKLSHSGEELKDVSALKLELDKKYKEKARGAFGLEGNGQNKGKSAPNTFLIWKKRMFIPDLLL